MQCRTAAKMQGKCEAQGGWLGKEGRWRTQAERSCRGRSSDGGGASKEGTRRRRGSRNAHSSQQETGVRCTCGAVAGCMFSCGHRHLSLTPTGNVTPIPIANEWPWRDKARQARQGRVYPAAPLARSNRFRRSSRLSLRLILVALSTSLPRPPAQRKFA